MTAGWLDGRLVSNGGYSILLFDSVASCNVVQWMEQYVDICCVERAVYGYVGCCDT
jgi:hypothetical protein